MRASQRSPASTLRNISWELIAATATLAAAITWSGDVTRDAHAVAERLGQARYQLETLADALAPLRALSASVDGERQVADLRARLAQHDWGALFPGRTPMLVPSPAGSGFNLVLAPSASTPCTTP